MWAALPAAAHFTGSAAVGAVVGLLTTPLLALAYIPSMVVTAALARWADGDVVYGVTSTLLLYAGAYGVLRAVGGRGRRPAPAATGSVTSHDA